VDGSPAGDGTEILHHTFTLPGTYVIGVELETTIEDSTACSGSSTLELTIYEPPEAGFKWEMIDLCHREVKFTDTTNAIIENNSWAIWDVASGELLMERENEESFSYQFASGGLKTVQLIVSDDKGCLDTIVRENLIIDNGFDFTIKYERSCFGEPIIFSVENIIPNTISNVNWEWKFHDGTIILNPESQFTYGQEGEYLVLLTAIFNEECLIQKDTTLYIQAPHLPEISIDTCYGPEVSFIGIPNNNLDLYASWEWLFGDKTSETITQITDPVFVLHQYANDSTYDVKLVIVDTLGCSDTIHLNGIRTFCDEQMGLWIPNAFAPDATEQVGDARYFMPKGNGIEEFEIKVFDLWGNQVWESSANGNPDEYWDGKYKNTNRDMPAGTYLFKAYARFKDGTVWQDDNGNNSGTILLIR
jgi:PKD repeat protein